MDIAVFYFYPQEKHGISLQYYMQEVQSQNNARCMLLLLTVLEELVANNTVDAKYAELILCELLYILNNNFNSEYFCLGAS